MAEKDVASSSAWTRLFGEQMSAVRVAWTARRCRWTSR